MANNQNNQTTPNPQDKNQQGQPGKNAPGQQDRNAPGQPGQKDADRKDGTQPDRQGGGAKEGGKEMPGQDKERAGQNSGH